jgi:hypothetical protein
LVFFSHSQMFFVLMSALGLVCQASIDDDHKTVYIELPVKHHTHTHTVYKHIYQKASEGKSKADEQEAPKKDDSSAHNGDAKSASQGEKHQMKEKFNGLEYKPTHDKAPAVKRKTVQYEVYEPSQEHDSSAHSGDSKSISLGGKQKSNWH